MFLRQPNFIVPEVLDKRRLRVQKRMGIGVGQTREGAQDYLPTKILLKRVVCIRGFTFPFFFLL